MSQPHQKLPLDIATFRILREQDYLYVDKTKHAYELITGGRRFFLNRPRRFGKSLLISMLGEILLGNRELFDGLWINSSDYTWKKHAVIMLDLSRITVATTQEFKERLNKALIDSAKSYNVFVTTKSMEPSSVLDDVVQAINKQYASVALLIDEYDGPILRRLHHQEPAHEMRDIIRDFFSTVKSLDKHLDFVMITGVSSFAKAGIFSGMNNLQVITMHDKRADICGYTDTELDTYFEPRLQEWSISESISCTALREKIKDWYNGYRFSSSNITVYNPFSLMNAIAEKKFKNFWIQTGAPQFLIEELQRKKRDDFTTFDTISLHPELLTISEDSLGIFDIGRTPLPALMFQTGYLTIADYDREADTYQLKYPNYEVERALKKYLFIIFTQLDESGTELVAFELKKAFLSQDIENIIDVLQRIMAHVPYQIHAKEEKFYHALLQVACTVAGVPAHSEYSTNQGRIDIVIELPEVFYIIEIKFNVPASVALAQIEERKYYEKFIKQNKRIFLLGLSFIREPSKFDIEYAMKTIQ